MKTQSFKNYLKQYVKSLTEGSTLSLNKINNQAKNNYRLKTIFSFYSLIDNDVENQLKKRKEDLSFLYGEYIKCKTNYGYISEDNLSDCIGSLSDFDELKKVYQYYEDTVLKKEKAVKELYLNKILTTQQKKHISKYKIYNTLNLNPGNTNDFLKNKKLNKMSLENTKKIYKFVNSIDK